jgi:hypothetical protein
VRGGDGHSLGTIERLVVDESAHRVTHVVVDGHLLGVRRLRAGPEGLLADLDRDQLKRLPAAEHDHVGAPGEHWTAPLGWRLDNFLRITGALIGQSPYVPPVHFDPELDDVHEITAGSPVWSGNAKLGEVEQVMTGDDGAVSELIIKREGVLSGHARVPGHRITEMVGNNVHTDLQPEELEAVHT